MKKGDIMLIEDHINLQGGSPLAFKNVAEFGSRFTDMSAPYDAKMRQKLIAMAKTDAVGMSTVPEVIVANHLNLPVIAVSVLTDECDPDNLKPVDIQEIIAIAGQTEPKMVRLFKELIKQL